MSVQYFEGIGRRKESTARVRLMSGPANSQSTKNRLKNTSLVLVISKQSLDLWQPLNRIAPHLISQPMFAVAVCPDKLIQSNWVSPVLW